MATILLLPDSGVVRIRCGGQFQTALTLRVMLLLIASYLYRYSDINRWHHVMLSTRTLYTTSFEGLFSAPSDNDYMNDYDNFYSTVT